MIWLKYASWYIIFTATVDSKKCFSRCVRRTFFFRQKYICFLQFLVISRFHFEKFSFVSVLSCSYQRFVTIKSLENHTIFKPATISKAFCGPPAGKV